VLVDLSECTFIDSTVINALIAAHNDLSQRQGRLEIVIQPGASAARRAVELTCLAEIVSVHSGRHALASLAGGGSA
jgi:anti-anti-sigma regulatory factor